MSLSIDNRSVPGPFNALGCDTDSQQGASTPQTSCETSREEMSGTGVQEALYPLYEEIGALRAMLVEQAARIAELETENAQLRPKASVPTASEPAAAGPESAHTMLLRIIQEQGKKEDERDIWKNSPYKGLVKLQSNNVGNVGEMFVNQICAATDIPAVCDGAKTKQLGGGAGDGTILGATVEVKMAHQGSGGPTFQHELGEVPWKGGRYMIFVDISPECVYLTVFKNFSEATYKDNKKLAVFPTKTVCWRKKKGAFKLDTSVKINEESIVKGHAIKITPATPNQTIAAFLRAKIV